MNKLIYDGVNRFQSTCFIVMKEDREVGYIEIIKDHGMSKNLTFDEVKRLSNIIVSMRESF